MVLGGSCPGGNCPRGSCPMGVIVLGGSCPRGSCPQGSCPRGSCPRGSCPVTVEVGNRGSFPLTLSPALSPNRPVDSYLLAGGPQV